MSLSKSKYCNGLQCKKMLWLYKNKPEVIENVNNERILEQGNLVHEVARYLFGNHINIKQNDNLNEMIKDTYYTIESYKNVIITEASFSFNNNFCSVDILVKNNDNYEIYEVKSSTSLKEVYINDISYQYYVLKSIGLNVKKCYLININNKYVRKGNLELEKIFIKTDVTDEVINKKDIVENNIKEINEYLERDIEEEKNISINCFEPYDCLFFKYCTKHLDENNVFKIASMTKKKKIELYDNNFISFKDLLNANLNKKYLDQIEFELFNKEDYIDKKSIKEFLNTLNKPLYFLDFETFQMPIPLYDNTSPYEQIPFQYSLHYYENNELKHKEFLSEPNIDPRRELAEQLIKDIPKDVCVLAYNMSFEKRVIKKLAEIYPDLSKHLMNIYNNIKDLMIPFQNRWYYSKNMQGSYSIKYVLPALFPNDKELDYHNLDLVHNGTEAMDNFLNLANLDKEEYEYIRKRLLKYCCLDTYAMVKIYEKLVMDTK